MTRPNGSWTTSLAPCSRNLACCHREVRPTAHLLTKLCIEYTITTEQGVTKHCNLLGQSNSTNNPTGCD